MPSPVRRGIALPLAAVILLIHALSASAKPVVLTVAGLGPQAARQLSEEGLDDFTRETGIQVEFVPAWGNSTDQLALTLRALNGHFPTPDIYMIDVLWPATLASHLLDLKPFLDAGAHEQSADLLTNDTVKGRLVALPFYLNIGTLFYRADLLKKYGYKHPPNTWEEMQHMAARIEKGERAAGNRDFWGYVFQGAAYEGLTCNALEWQMSFGGGHIIEPDGTVSVNNARTAEALRKVRGWIHSISPPSVLSYTEADSLNAFRSGNAAFLRYWSSGYNSVANSSALRARFQMSVLPAGPRGRAQAMGGFQLAVSAYSKHPREAVQLVVYLTGAHVQKCRALREGYLPTLPRLYDDPELLKAVSAARVLKTVGLTGWVARPSTTAGSHYAQVSRIYYQGVHEILSGQRRIEDVLSGVEEQLLAVSPNFQSPRN
ncbi:MAG TPA: extracellular solute-binding protein [Bryobacteraceae bacterium]|jgi:trehalose/maltose transport system substrate-binding protein|nr:extracellular solute-binding protein [Bryobacteraceae bacterium]